MTWLRAIAAAILSVIMPGAGHALIREWLRALLFAGVFFTAVAIFMPEAAEQVAAADTIANGMDVVAEETSTTSQFVLSFIALFAAIDAALRAVGFPPGSANQSADGPTCPECGKELDEELAFCHWCTTRLEPPADEEFEPGSDSEAERPTGP
ncbi:DUF7575 domain-containing protein [Halosolutus gelatinilyticus]|uniref:DUF7575 domain-containing protein n=1 Tax=Halosolutus gelatinilyticus TaxID=2931975 RepID=UPI001FF3FD0F|nr:zinc ribbon domain-containing protein [Halosolutus gelatinilyticus]